MRHTTKLMTAIALSTLLISAPTAAKAEMTKAEVEKIVEEYLMNNGEVILKSVDSFQRKSMSEKHANAVKNNHDDLFRDMRAPTAGNEKGDVTVVEFFDYNCGYCKRAVPMIEGLIEEDKNVKILFKELPILGPTSETAARWALAAHKQGKYFAFHQKLMAHKGQFTDEALASLAKESGLDVEQIKKDAAGSDITIQIEKNRALAGQMGIAGTPAFVVGEEVIPGAVPKETLKARIDDLRKKNAAPKEETKK